MAKNLQDEYDNQSTNNSGEGGEEKQTTLCGSACCYECVAFELRLTKSLCSCMCNNIECCM